MHLINYHIGATPRDITLSDALNDLKRLKRGDEEALKRLKRVIKMAD